LTYPLCLTEKRAVACMDPELLATGLRKGADTGPAPAVLGEKSQLKPSREGGDMTRDKEKPIWDMMLED
jgi:hypothetical protein